MKHFLVIMRVFFLSLGLLWSGVQGTAFAYADDQNAALKALKRGDILPYAQIRRKVEQSLGGQVVGSNLRRTNKGWQYDLRVRRDNGKVLVAIVDAKSGRILVTK